LLEQAAERARAGQGPVHLVEHLEQPARPAEPHLASLLRYQQPELLGDHLTEQRLARAEPAVDRRAPKTQPAGDQREVDALPIQVLLGDHSNHVVSRRRGRSTSSCVRWHAPRENSSI
jgi:hypothetical protein